MDQPLFTLLGSATFSSTGIQVSVASVKMLIQSIMGAVAYMVPS